MIKRYTVEGMSCASCAATVEKAVQNINGVIKAQVNLTNDELIIEAEKVADLDVKVENAVDKAGYHLIIPTQEAKFHISGMSCASCASTVEKAVAQIDGVEHSQVNLATEELTVRYRPQTDFEQKVEKRVEEAGYMAEVSHTNVETMQAKEAKRKERREKTLKATWTSFIWSAVFSVILLYLAMGPMIGLPIPFSLYHYTLSLAIIEMLLTIPVLYIGRDFFRRGFKALLVRQPNMDSLVAIGTSVSFIYSIFNTIMIAIGDTSLVHHLYYESAAVILTLITLGNFFEGRATGKTTEAISKLVNLVPAKTEVKRDEQFVEIPVADLCRGDIVRVKAGASIPIDGYVVTGRTHVDESMFTGESRPVTKGKNDEVIGGSVNIDGVIEVEVTKIGSETMLSQMVRLVEEAQNTKAPIAKFADKIARIFVPTVLVLALLSFIMWKVFLGATWGFAMTTLISVLVIACPCALGLATPTAIMVGTGRGAENGILIKNGEALERASQMKAILFDKTGTLTQGKPSVTAMTSFVGDEQTMLIQLASLEQASEHPLAKAILAKASNLELKKVEKFEVLAGEGVQGMIDGVMYKACRTASIPKKWYTADMQMVLDDYSKRSMTPVWLLDDKQVLGIVGISDSVKGSAKATIQALQQRGVEVAMVTGDHHQTAETIAKELGIQRVYSEVLPEAKAKKVKDLQKHVDGVVAMVGDGVNDAPALATADVGISIGSGTDIAIESADVVLMHSQLDDIVKLIELSFMTMRNIKQNLFWAFAYNILGIPVAMGILHLFGGPLLNPMIAGAAMSLSSLCVVLNALRLKYMKWK